MKTPRTPLDIDRPVAIKFCIECGYEYPTQRRNSKFCSTACLVREWRAVSMLAGIHDYVNGRFVRLPRQDMAYAT